ncbi:transporter substrate-binding domain-containing protein [Anaerovorax odorimutans]|uniref:Stage 0 sporulation protein A homolog n=1 Tax=Anaerovorax odorimutans TaxID=109327 RepID=A0ABT1RP36_9FIRM|nr:transporter substrate-binding domain-containing protein [Anaerovorax odorimutans]MCQ4636947.1 transporter substrate-binding domain-containing protein [Anaerovorax odorimutans]
MKKRMRTGSVLLIAIILLFSLAAAPVFGAEDTAKGEQQQVLTVAFPETKGLQEVYKDGTYGGLIYDWLMEIAKYTGWKYKFVTGDVEELLTGMAEGKYDLMGGMLYQKEYEQYFAYPQYAVGSNYCLLGSRKDDSSIKSFDVTTLNGKTIGVYKKAVGKIERLKVFLKANQLTCKIKEYEDVKAYEKCLDNKETDLILTSDATLKDTYNVCARFTAESYYIVTKASDTKSCEQMNQAIEKIYEANPNMAEELYDKYFPNAYSNSIDLSKEDKDYIKKSAPIRVAVLKDGYPLTYIQHGELKGIVPEVYELIRGLTGLKFEYVYASSYADAMELMRSGKADIVGSYLSDSYQANGQKLVLTKQYAQLNTVIIRNKRAELSGGDLTVAVPKEMSAPNDGNHKKIAYYETFKKCLDAVDAGDADYMEIPSALLESLFTSHYYANVTPSAVGDQQMPVSIAMSDKPDVELYSILSKAVNSLDERKVESIRQQNLISSQISQPDLKTMLYSHIGAVVAFLIGFVILLIIVFLTIGRLRLKSREMELKLEKAEETAQAKSDFLSRMSHEIRTPMNAIIGLTSLSKRIDNAPDSINENLEKIDTSAKFLLSLVNDILDMSKLQSNKMTIESEPFSLKQLLVQIEDIFSLQAKEKDLQLDFSYSLTEDGFIGDKTRLAQVMVNLLSNACKFTPKGGRIGCSAEEKKRDNDRALIEFRVKDTGIGIPEEDIERIFGSFEQLSQNDGSVQGTGLGLAISSNLVQLMGSRLEVKSRLGEGSEFFFTLELPLSAEGAKAYERPDNVNKEKQLSGMNILLAEDNDLNAEIAISLLELEGAEVFRAADGQKTVEMFSTSKEGFYQAVLMDVQMPILNGLEAASRIRGLDRNDAQEVGIIAMTANSFKEDREKALAAGMNGFIAKPFEAEDLIVNLLAYKKVFI